MHSLVGVTCQERRADTEVELLGDKDSYHDLPELLANSDAEKVLLIVFDDDENFQCALDLLTDSFAGDGQESAHD